MKDYVGSRSLRKKHSKTYVDGMSSSDEEEEMKTFDPEEKIKSKDFPPYFVTELKGEDVTFQMFQSNGFNNPLFVPDKTGLHIRVPDPSFSVTDVKNLVGGKRILEVMNCATQLNAEMTLKDFEEFFIDPDRDDTKLNVISLEFSHTRLDAHVSAPRVIRQIDFTDNVWPRQLKEQQDDSTNDMSKMFYPKIQKYCLMSIEGCYTDFHVDLGGTSVWYHLLRGQKIFWLIPPTPGNLKAFEHWTLSGKQGEVFFGDMVERCGRVVLNPGNTFFIPSGWIHAVYTPVDSLVFGGNYLHPFAMERQIRIAQIEETLKVPQKFRFPFFTEMLWYMLDKYCYALLGRHHLNFDDSVLNRLLGSEEERKTFQENIGHPHITQHEIRGLKATVLYLHSLPVNKKNVPGFIKDPVSLIRDIRIIVEVHKNDRPERANSGRPLLYWPGLKKDANWFTKGKRRKRDNSEKAKRIEVDGTQYLDPSLMCSYCNLDGWFTSPSLDNITRSNHTNSLMECSDCHELVHSLCLPDFGITCTVYKEMPGYWKCANCQKFPKEEKKPQENGSNGTENGSNGTENGSNGTEKETNGSSAETVKPKEEVQAEEFDVSKVKDEPQAYEENTDEQQNLEEPVTQMEVTENGVKTEDVPPQDLNSFVKEEVPEPNEKSDSLRLRVNEFFSRNGGQFKKFVSIFALEPHERPSAILMDDFIVVKIFNFLGTKDIMRCKSVCKTWLRFSKDKSLSRFVDLSGLKINALMMNMTSNLKPESLNLDWSNIGKQQLTWLLPKITATKRLSLVGLEFASQVSALANPQCPYLVVLDLSFVSNLSDAAVNKLLMRTAEKKSNLSGLRQLYLCNTEISDISLRYISQQLQLLTRLSIAGCAKISDAGLAQIGDPDLYLSQSLVSLTLDGCQGVTDSGLVHISRCTMLSRIECKDTGITQNAINLYLQIRTDLCNKDFVIYQKTT